MKLADVIKSSLKYIKYDNRVTFVQMFKLKYNSFYIKTRVRKYGNVFTIIADPTIEIKTS